MINRLAWLLLVGIVLTVGGQEHTVDIGNSPIIRWGNIPDEKGRYLLVYSEQFPAGYTDYGVILMPKTEEHSVYKYFPTIESALAWMNQGSEPRVSKKMFVSLSYVIDLPLDLESETVRINREVSKWRVKQ